MAYVGYVADVLINHSTFKTSSKVSPSAQFNTYTQSWNPSLHATSKLSKDIIQMMKTGQKFDVNFQALKLSDLAKWQLPAWYHLGTGRHMMSLNNQNTSKCLRDNHIVKAVGDLVQCINQDQDPSTTSKGEHECTCG
jgi:hypothetical protein